MRSNWRKRATGYARLGRARLGFCSGFILLLTVVASGLAQNKTLPMSADSVAAASVPSNATPIPNEMISVAINVDFSALQAPNNRLAAYQSTLNWNPSVLQFVSVAPAPAPWDTPNLNLNNAATGKIEWNDFVAGGAPGKINILNVNYKVVGAAGSSTILDLNFTEMTTSTFQSVLNVLRTTDGKVTVRGNDPPVLAAIADQTMNEGATLNVAVSATDPENGKIKFSTINLPSFGVLIDNNNNTGAVRFQPGFDAAGVYAAIGVVATDDGVPAKSDTAFFKLTVINVNRAPVLAAIADQTMNEGATLNVAVSATDPENGKIKFSTINLPSFGVLIDNNNNTGAVRFQPGFEAAGVYAAIGVVATDDGVPAKSDTAFFKLTVINVNRAPVLAAIADQTMNEGATLNVAVSATDPDNDKITFIAINSPAFGILIDNNNNTATVRFAPDFAAAGVYAGIGVIATDNGIPLKSDTTFFRLTVNNVNRAPQITPLPAQISINEGEASIIPLSATDADGDSIKLSAQNLPAFATVIDNGNGSGRLRLTPGRENSGDYPNIVAFATDNGAPPLSDSTRFNLKVIDTLPALACKIEIVKPNDGDAVCDDSMEVCVRTEITGALGTVVKACEVNGVPVLFDCVKIPVAVGVNKIIAKLTVKDSLDTCVSFDSVTVSRRQLTLDCRINITTPPDSATFCSDSLEVKGTTLITGGVPFAIKCDVNGVPVVIAGNTFTARVKLNAGWNNVIAACTITDSCGATVVCRDTVRVRSIIDNIAPTSTFTPGYKSVTGTFFDNESGIAKIEPLFLYNARLTVDPFTPGDKKVNFRLDDLGQDSYLGFDIKITDLCGNTHICDPVAMELTADRANHPYVFTFRSVDRYFHLKNHGLSEIRVQLNDHQFSISSERRGGAVQSLSLYTVPREGEMTIDLGPYLRAAGENNIRLEVAGPAGSRADLLLIDAVHEAMQTLQQPPDEYELSQNYPNPFNPETMIRFSIPPEIAAGALVEVKLQIYNTLGELVRTLVDQTMPPGRYTARWNGRNQLGKQVAAGIYLYRIVAGEYSATKRMLLLK